MSRKPTGPRSCPDISSRERFAQTLYRAAMPSRDQQRVALTLAAGCQLLVNGVERAFPGITRDWLLKLADADQPAKELGMLFEEHARALPYLARTINGLIGWVDTANDGDIDATRACARLLAEYDWGRMVDEADGELLGQLYPWMLSKSKRDALGIFYTPMPLSKMMALMLMQQVPAEGERVLDPCCGAGGMLIAAIEVLRENEVDPKKVHFCAIDKDPIAAALCAVNMASHGLVNVEVRCEDALLGPQRDPISGEVAS